MLTNLSPAMFCYPRRASLKFLSRAEIASGVRFCFVHKFFYRFGIRSCLARSHKQMLKTQFSMTSLSVSIQHGHRLGLILFILVYCALANCLANRKVVLRQITAGCKHNSGRLDKWLKILAVEDLTPKERPPELQRKQRRRRPVRSSSALCEAQAVNKRGKNAKRF